MLSMIDAAVAGSAPFLPVRLVVFPEFAHAAPVFATVEELLEKLAVPIPNEHTDRLDRKAREHGIYIQSGSMLEADPRWPGRRVQHHVPDRARGHPLQVPEGQSRGFPYEVHASPHDSPGYDEPLFPVADTPIGRIGCAICYDWLFPEAIRQLAANGAEVLIRVSAYMDPVGRDRADELVDASSTAAARSRTSRTSSPPTRARACGTTRRTHGRAAARSSTSTAACSPKRRRGPASGSSSRPSTSRRCATSADTQRRAPHARAPAHRGVRALPHTPLPARGALGAALLRGERAPGRDREGEAAIR